MKKEPTMQTSLFPKRMLATGFYPAEHALSKRTTDRKIHVSIVNEYRRVVGNMSLRMGSDSISKIQLEGVGQVFINELSDPLFIAYHSRRFWSYTFAQGIGSKLNPITPHEDCAHNHLPWGSRVDYIFENDSDNRIHTCYTGSVFGREQPNNRIDLYVHQSQGAKLKQWIKVNVRQPHITYVKASNLKKQFQRNLKTLNLYTGKIDGVIGPLTRSAWKKFVDKYDTDSALNKFQYPFTAKNYHVLDQLINGKVE